MDQEESRELGQALDLFLDEALDLATRWTGNGLPGPGSVRCL